MTKTLEQAEIDQDVGEGVEIGDGIAVAEVGTFNAESDRLAIDAFGGRALFVNIFVDLALPVERITQASANASRHGNPTAAFARAFMMNRTRLFDESVFDVFGKERADVLAAFMFEEGDGSVCVGEQKRHG